MSLEIEVIVDKTNKILLVTTIIIIGFAFSIIYHYITGIYFGLGYPFNTFLFDSNDKFADFYNNLLMCSNPYNILDGSHNHFPLLQHFSSLFKPLGNILGLLVHISIYISFFIYISYKNLKSSNKALFFLSIFAFTFMSYPNIFAIDRGNFEVYCFITLFLFIHFYQKKQYTLSIILLSLASALKPFNLIFLLLPLSDKKYKEAFLTFLITIIISVIGYSMFPGGFVANVINHFKVLNIYYMSNVILNTYHAQEHSLYGMAQDIILLLNGKFNANLLDPTNIYVAKKIMITAKIFSFLTLISLSLVSLYIFLIEKVFWRKVAVLTVTMLLLILVSPDYRLIHLFIPLFLFINYDRKGKYDLIYIILFSLLLIPKNYHFMLSSPFAPISTIINPLILSGLITTLIIEGFSAKTAKETNNGQN